LPRGVPRGPVAAASLLLILPACAGDPPSILEPAGPSAERVAWLWWFMFAIAAGVVAFVSALLLFGALRRRSRADLRPEPRWATGLLVGGGIVFPVLVLGLLWAFTLRDTAELATPPGPPDVRIEVVGKRWWWDVRYPDLGLVTANEIHVPVGQTVQVVLRSADVIHSVWVPELTPKVDMIPGRTNRMWFVADRPGTYRGQCAEFCGVQHAKMAFLVIAEPEADFDAWAQGQRGPAASPTDDLAQRGLEVFLDAPCVGCHAIRGTEATAEVGPDLTHLASRRTLGALTVPNTEEWLLTWVPDAQQLKPGALMPPVPLSADELEALVAYLETLE
jgi:cytochrome c oxidase subunit II